MTLETIRDLLSLIAGEKGISNNFHFDDLSDMINYAQLKYYKQRVGLPEEYAPGMPLPKLSYEITARLTEDLRPFKVVIGGGSSTPVNMDTDGHLVYPADYFYPTSITYYNVTGGLTYIRKVERLNDLEYEEAVSSISTAPDEMFPVCNFQASYIRFTPIMTGNLSMTYLRLPKDAKYVVKLTDGYYEYDAVNSIELEWGDIQIIDILAILLGDLGIPLSNQNIINYAQELKTKGV